MMGYIFINGVPFNRWPIINHSRLQDIAEVEDVEYTEVESVTIESNENVERDN